jgi:hypothetical protein
MIPDGPQDEFQRMRVCIGCDIDVVYSYLVLLKNKYIDTLNFSFFISHMIGRGPKNS